MCINVHVCAPLLIDSSCFPEINNSNMIDVQTFVGGLEFDILIGIECTVQNLYVVKSIACIQNEDWYL